MSAASAAPSSYKGFLFDIGGHRFFSKSKEVVDLWNEILPDDFIERPRLSRIYLRRQILRLSAEGLRGAAQPRPARRAPPAWPPSPGPRPVPIKQPETFHQWVRNQFGERLFSIFFKTYTEKVWGMSLRRDLRRLGGAADQGPDLGAAVIDGLRRSLGLNASRGEARRRQDADRILPLSAPRPRHDVGGRARRRSRAMGGRIADGPHARGAALGRRRAGCGRSTVAQRRRRDARRITAAPRHLLGADARADGGDLSPRR